MMTDVERTGPFTVERVRIAPANEASWGPAITTEIAHSLLTAGVSNAGWARLVLRATFGGRF